MIDPPPASRMAGATAWIPATVAATALRKIGDKRTRMIGINDDPIILDGIKDGYVTGTMLQNPYGQAYIGSFALGKLVSGCKVKADAPWLKTPQTAHFIDSGTAYVGSADLANYQDKMKAVTKDILASFQQKFLDCP